MDGPGPNNYPNSSRPLGGQQHGGDMPRGGPEGLQQQAGNVAVLVQLDSSDLAAVLQQPNAAQLLDEVCDQHQLQQQQQYDEVVCDDDDESSMLYVPTDDEDS
jgi:hypothetical protein